MICEVKLYKAGIVFKEEVVARDYQDARETALARNPNATIIESPQYTKMIDNTCVIYTNGSQECERVAALLRALGGEFHEYKQPHFDQRAFEDEFGSAEYPQVAIGASTLAV